MAAIDTFLDKSLLGYTKLGTLARHIDVKEEFPGISGGHVMVTGATGGIGRAVTQRLVANGAVVHAVGRSREKLDALQTDTNGTVITHQTDLSNMGSIEDLATDFLRAGHRLDGIVNNVGVMTHERVITDEGFELTYALNLLGQYVLVMNLLPALVTSSPSRIVMVSSGGMYSQSLDVMNLQSSEGEYDGTAAYAHTKRGQVVLAEQWARTLAVDGIRPGLEWHLDVLAHGHVGVQRIALEDHRDVAILGLYVVDDAIADQHLARADCLEPGDHSQDRSLAAT